MKPEYKQTEVGVIPEDWNVVKLGRVASFKTGPFGSALHQSDYVYGGIPIVNPMQIVDGRIVPTPSMAISPAASRKLADFRLSLGDIVIGRRGEMGRCANVQSAEDGWLCGTGSMIVKPSPALDGRFAQRVLSSPSVIAAIENCSVGTTMINLNQGTLSNLVIALPPTKEEQEDIAEALSDADTLIESLERLLAKKRDLKQGAMQELLTGKRRLPGYVNPWAKRRLGEVLSIGHGKSQRAVEDPNGQYPILATGGQIGTANQFMYDKPSVLIGRKGTIDQPQYMDTPFWTVDTLFYSVVQAPNHAKFLYYRFCLIDWKQYNEASGVPSLNGRTIESIEVSIPDAGEQAAIADMLSDMDADIASIEARLSKARQLKQGMMQELLTGRIRLVPSSSNVVSLPVKQVEAKSSGGEHNSQINEAVVLSILTHRFGSEKFPLGRFRRTKLTYLLHRHVEHEAQGFLKKAAGPYNPQIKYGGAEKIAIKNGYVRQHKSGQFEGFVAADNIDKAHAYFDKWYGADVLQWLDKFKFKKKDELELLTTVDMAMHDLTKQGQEVNLESVKMVIKDHPEWTPKLDRAVFSDDNIVRAMAECRTLFVD